MSCVRRYVPLLRDVLRSSSGLSSGVRDCEGRELAEARGLDPREVLGWQELPAVAVLRPERRRMLDEIFGAAGRG